MTKYISESNAGKQRHLHTTEDCPRLSNAYNVREARQTDDYPDCEWCHGATPDNSGEQNKASYRAIRDADPDSI